MDYKAFFPAAQNVDNTTSLVTSIIIHLMVGIVGGVICRIIGIIPIIGWLVSGALGIVVCVYVVVGIVLSVRSYLRANR